MPEDTAGRPDAVAEQAADSHERLALRVAREYYVTGRTMEAIGHDLGISRSTVSRLLSFARDEGLVTITVAPPERDAPVLAAALHDRFGIAAHVVPVRHRSTLLEDLDAVARRAAALLAEHIGPGTVLGVAWGTTTNAVSRVLQPKDVTGVQVVQLNGAGSSSTAGEEYAAGILGRFAQAFRGQVQTFPVPTFFDYVETKHAMWRERSVLRVLELQDHVDVALFGLGTASGGVPSRVNSAGYIDPSDQEAMRRAGVVGDVCTVFLRPDGTWRGLPINERSSGTPPDRLARVQRRICAVAGPNKVPVTLACLRSGVATDLVIDERSAAELLDRA